MLIALWIINGLLALAFLGAGVFKLVRPRPALIEAGLAWAEDFSPLAIRLIATAEVLGALGLVLPLATGILPILTPIAAAALAALMIGATVVHLRRKETPVPTLVLAALAAASAVIGALVVLAG